MSRPKESTFGIVSGLASIYSANKIRTLDRKYKEMGVQNARHIDDGFNKMNHGLRQLGELSFATMAGIYQLDLKVNELLDTQSALVNHFENERIRKDHLENLVLFMREVKKEVSHIRALFADYPVWAVYLARILQDMFLERNITIYQFKSLNRTDIDWAEEIIEDVKSLHSDLYNLLE